MDIIIIVSECEAWITPRFHPFKTDNDCLKYTFFFSQSSMMIFVWNTGSKFSKMSLNIPSHM